MATTPSDVATINQLEIVCTDCGEHLATISLTAPNGTHLRTVVGRLGHLRCFACYRAQGMGPGRAERVAR
jgi:hypothetical protein